MSEVEQAKALIEARKAERAAECGKSIEEVLKAHNCRMEPQVTMRGQTISWQFVIVPND
jgi:hypothetical protein